MLEDISGEKIKEQFKSNKNLRNGVFAIGGILVIVLGYFAYRQFMWKPANEKSKDSSWVALNHIAKDSTDLAIEELTLQVKKYDGKVGGEVDQFLLARQLMTKGEYEAALKELNGVDVSDTYIHIMSVGLQADCYSELEDYAEAASLYKKAASMSPNEFTSPMYLLKAGLCLEEIKNFEEATKCYTEIRDEYPAYGNQKHIEKYIARAENVTVK